MKKLLFLLLLLPSTAFAAPHETVWTPDTCDCQVVYEWDDEVPAEDRVHTFKRIIKRDQNHVSMATDKAQFDAILDENQRKNKVHGNLLSVQQLSQSVTNSDGSSSIQLKNGVNVSYAYTGVDPTRVLTVTITGVTLTTNQKTAIQNWCNTNLGVGKVVINN